jgi:nucleoside-diphosphate-sugar epimerase
MSRPSPQPARCSNILLAIRVLVLGGTGFVGRHVVSACLELTVSGMTSAVRPSSGKEH